jgi:hypothetical protein
VKKAKKPSRSIQYRLLADRKLQRLSLRKVTERLKKVKKTSRSIRSKNRAAEMASTRFAWPTSSGAIVFAMICVVVAVALVTARQAPPRAEVADIEAPPAAALPRDIPTPRGTKNPVIAKASAPAPLKAAVVESPSQAGLPDAGAVTTMTGCLELDEETFRLADVSGVDAPQSRSWKSGFLKKRPAKVELVDATHSLRLPSHVGRRVAATGTLIDGEMRAHSLRLVASSCRS